MTRLSRTLVLAPLSAALSLSLTAAPASAAHGLDSVDLVTGSLPEGISAGPGTTFFAGARSDGAVYVGDVVTGELDTLVAGDDQGPAVGLLHDTATDRLWVAGGNGADVTAYDADTGRELFRAVTGGPDDHFLNDVAITPDAVYVTDSRRKELVVVDTPGGALPADGTFRRLPLTGDYEQPQGFGANGIRVLPDGDLLLVSGGVLYVVDPATGAADRVEQRGRALRGGDGLVLDGSTLYVVNGYGGNEVAVLRLLDGATRTQAVGVLRDEELDRPTTGALIDGALYVVNGRFSVADETTEHTITRLRTR